METIKKTKTVEYTVYRTIDGKEFHFQSDAILHENILKGDRKPCEKCKGTGRINIRYEKEWINKSMIPTDSEEVEVLKSDTCDICKGKGYLEKKWV